MYFIQKLCCLRLWSPYELFLKKCLKKLALYLLKRRQSYAGICAGTENYSKKPGFALTNRGIVPTYYVAWKPVLKKKHTCYVNRLAYHSRWASLLFITPLKSITICIFFNLPGLQKPGRNPFPKKFLLSD